VSKNLSWLNTKIVPLSGEQLIASADSEPAARRFATKQLKAAVIEHWRSLHPDLPHDPKRLELRRNLLRFGGWEVNPTPYEPHLNILISERAMVWDGATSKRIRGGKRHRCHTNVARHYERQVRPRWRIATGYALADYGVWCQHSWLCSDKSIGETTTEFMAYAGVILDDVESVLFWLNEREEPWPEPLPPALRLDDPRVKEGVMRALAPRSQDMLRRALDAHVTELQAEDHVSQDSADSGGPAQLPAE
jgi:hypothetical protein